MFAPTVVLLFLNSTHHLKMWEWAFYRLLKPGAGRRVKPDFDSTEEKKIKEGKIISFDCGGRRRCHCRNMMWSCDVHLQIMASIFVSKSCTECVWILVCGLSSEVCLPVSRSQTPHGALLHGNWFRIEAITVVFVVKSASLTDSLLHTECSNMATMQTHHGYENFRGSWHTGYGNNLQLLWFRMKLNNSFWATTKANI